MKTGTAVILLLLMASLASAKDVGERPDSVAADATVTTGEELSEAPTTQKVNANISITRAHETDTAVGEAVQVTIKVTNNHDKKLTLVVVDPQRPGLTYVDTPQPYMRRYEKLTVPLMRWQQDFNPGQSRQYTYSVTKATPGSVLLAAASVTDQYGNTYTTPPSQITFTCKPDGVCQKGENYIFCPQDCPTGSKDDTCDGIKDGRVDPDCLPEADPDYKVTTTTLPDRVPLKKTKGCIPLLTALFAALLSAAVKTTNL